MVCLNHRDVSGNPLTYPKICWRTPNINSVHLNCSWKTNSSLKPTIPMLQFTIIILLFSTYFIGFCSLKRNLIKHYNFDEIRNIVIIAVTQFQPRFQPSALTFYQFGTQITIIDQSTVAEHRNHIITSGSKSWAFSRKVLIKMHVTVAWTIMMIAAIT